MSNGDQNWLDSQAIQQILPHRPPFVWVDRIVALSPGRAARGVKMVSRDDPLAPLGSDSYFPRVLMLEAIAQVAAVALMASPTSVAGEPAPGWEPPGRDASSEVIPLFAGMEMVHFGRPARAGDVIEIEVEVERVRRSAARVRGRCRVEGEMAVEGTFLFAREERRNAGNTGVAG